MKKMKKKGIIVMVIVALVLAVVIILLVKKKTTNSDEDKTTNSDKKTTINSQTISEREAAQITRELDRSNTTFPLKIGSRGQAVKDVQSRLGVDVDGIFGEKTQAALMELTGGKKEVTKAQYEAMWLLGGREWWTY